MSKTYTRADLTEAIGKLPQAHLADLPTPLHDCPRLSEALGGAHILIKRDDATGLAFGGNKTRKFDFTFGEVKRRGADVIITGAASQSNHSRQAAAAAAKMGVKAYLVLRRDKKSQEGIQGNLLLDHILGAEVRLAESGDQSEAKRRLEEELKAKGHHPYLIGHYDNMLGAVAYTRCAMEIDEQMERLGLEADYVMLASGSGTQAGIALGGKALGMKYRAIGFRPSPGGDDRRAAGNISSLANEAAELLGLDVRLSADDLENHDQYAGEAYGILTEAGCEAVQLVARTEGIFLDPVYVGKAMSGLIDYIRTGKIGSNKTVVFVHTGGTPALFAYNQEFIRHGNYQPKVVEAGAPVL